MLRRRRCALIKNRKMSMAPSAFYVLFHMMSYLLEGYPGESGRSNIQMLDQRGSRQRHRRLDSPAERSPGSNQTTVSDQILGQAKKPLPWQITRVEIDKLMFGNYRPVS
jgi:hypothetical protein